MKLYSFLAAYGTVLMMELIGDKSLLTISTLATRFRPLPVFCGMTVAFMGKVSGAVLLGQAVAELPAALVATLSAMTFFITAIAIWFKKAKETTLDVDRSRYWSKVALISFAAIFFSEWADIGQITAATLVARYQAPVVVWLGATSALTTKGIVAITLGMTLRKRVSYATLRYAAVCLCFVMGILCAFGIGS